MGDLERRDLSAAPLIYLHGRALDLTRRSEAPHIVLSTSSFAKRSNRNNPLFQRLANDLTTAEQILFIGYSAGDEAVREILRERPETKNKVTFVLRVDEPESTVIRLSRYGKVWKCGVDGFARKLADHTINDDIASRPSLLQKVQHQPEAPLNEHSAIQVFMEGGFPFGEYSYAIEDPSSSVQILERTATTSILSAHTDHMNRFVLFGPASSGKSFALNQIAVRLAKDGYECFLVERMDEQVLSEINDIMSRDKRAAFLFDDASRHLRELSHVCAALKPLQRVVAAFDSTFYSQRHSQIHRIMNGAYRSEDLSVLDNSEIAALDQFLERFALWGRLDDWTGTTASFIKHRCQRELRGVLAYLFRHGAVGRRLESLFSKFAAEDGEVKQGLLALLILGMARGQSTFPAREVLDWVDVSETRMRHAFGSGTFSDAFLRDGAISAPKSRALCAFLVQSAPFREFDVVPASVEMMRSFSQNSKLNINAKQILIECMKYRFIREIFRGRKDSDASLNRFYSNLADISDFRENDQFWLQYGIANDTLGAFDLAYKKYGTSLRMGKAMGEGYFTKQVENRLARLLLNPAAITEISLSEDEAIFEAISLLSDNIEKCDNKELIYPLRAAEHILNLINQKYDSLSSESVDQLKRYYRRMKDRFPELEISRARRGEKRKIREELEAIYFKFEG